MQGGQLRAARGIYGDNFKMQGGQLRTELLVMLILLPNSKHSICHCETVQAVPRNKLDLCTCSLGGFIQASLPRLSHTRARSRVNLSIASRGGGIQAVI